MTTTDTTYAKCTMFCHFSARQYQMHFPEWTSFDFDEYFTEMCSPGNMILFQCKPLKDVASQASHYQHHVIQTQNCVFATPITHVDVIKWKHFPRYWPSVRGIHRSPMNSPLKSQWRGALMFSLICAWTNGWTNHWDARDLRRHGAHYDATVMVMVLWITVFHFAGITSGSSFPWGPW